jgi:hypothetical protein
MKLHFHGLTHYLLLILLFGGCALVEESPAPTHSNSQQTIREEISRLKRQFEDKQYEQLLVQPLNDTSSLLWEPQWDTAAKQVGGDSSYFYIPLHLTRKSYHSGKESIPLELIATRKYLLAKVKGPTPAFLLATYLFKVEKDNRNDPAKKPNPYSAFTGIVLTQGITSTLRNRSEYRNGILLSVTAARGQKATTSTSCSNLWNCMWENPPSVCSSGSTYTTTSGYDGCSYPDSPVCGSWNQIQTTISDYCYSNGGGGPGWPPTGGGSGNGEGGSGGDSSGDPSNGGGDTDQLPSLEDNLTSNQIGLYGPCPGLTDAWVPLIKFIPPTVVLNRLNNLTAQEQQAVNIALGAVPGGSSAFSWQRQSIQNASGIAVNLDYFRTSIHTMPYQNGVRMTGPQLVEYIRLHLNDFIDASQPQFTPHPNIAGENTRWQNGELGSILSIAIPGDPGSVILSDHSANHWTFTTIHDPFNGAHPVSGNRKFGYEYTPAGSRWDYIFGTVSTPELHTFYIQGADRINYRSIELLGSLLNGSTSSNNALQFSAGDRLWQNMQGKVIEFVNQHGGVATLGLNYTNRPKWEDVKLALQTGRSLNKIPCD